MGHNGYTFGKGLWEMTLDYYDMFEFTVPATKMNNTHDVYANREQTTHKNSTITGV